MLVTDILGQPDPTLRVTAAALNAAVAEDQFTLSLEEFHAGWVRQHFLILQNLSACFLQHFVLSKEGHMPRMKQSLLQFDDKSLAIAYDSKYPCAKIR